jgi:hypothetical protein
VHAVPGRPLSLLVVVEERAVPGGWLSPRKLEPCGPGIVTTIKRSLTRPDLTSLDPVGVESAEKLQASWLACAPPAQYIPRAAVVVDPRQLRCAASSIARSGQSTPHVAWSLYGWDEWERSASILITTLRQAESITAALRLEHADQPWSREQQLQTRPQWSPRVSRPLRSHSLSGPTPA